MAPSGVGGASRFTVNTNRRILASRVGKGYCRMASILIHRGTKQIGGCVTEIRTETTRVFIDIGDNLPNVSGELPPVEGLTTGDGTNSALFLTHYHGDHIGLLDKVLPTIPVYMSASAKAVQLNLSARIYPDKFPLFEKIRGS